MKKYRLKQWYPGTPSYMMEGFIVDYYDEEEKAIYTYPDGMRLGFKLPSHHLECRNFWELIEEKEPLFITEDGVEIFSGQTCFYIDIKFNKRALFALDSELAEGVKTFKYESNADEYIWRNKPLFSYEDFIRWGNVPYERVIMQLAKERAGNGE